jgi:hypothetical protein
MGLAWSIGEKLSRDRAADERADRRQRRKGRKNAVAEA